MQTKLKKLEKTSQFAQKTIFIYKKLEKTIYKTKSRCYNQGIIKGGNTNETSNNNSRNY